MAFDNLRMRRGNLFVQTLAEQNVKKFLQIFNSLKNKFVRILARQ